MAATVQIFDRIPIVAAINNDCLSATGRGTLIFSPQKSGKSHLMRYIYSLRTANDAIFCWVNMDLMRAQAANPEKLTDRDFLRYMLMRLAEELEDKITELNPKEARWKADLMAARAQLNVPPPSGTPPDRYQQIVSQTVDALEAPLNMLNTLRLIADDVALSHEASDAYLLDLFHESLEQLQAVRKRVILFIDDFHYVLKQSDFSQNLKYTLRGANSEGRLVLLLSSAIRLMDPSIGRGGTQDIGTVFNDLKLQVLEPFDRELAEKFLDWLGSQDGQTLAADERAYLCELGGGSPQFIETARSLYVGRVPRPLTQEQRSAFEANVLYPALEAGFAQIWSRCTMEQRRACRDLIKSGSPSAPNIDLGAGNCFVACAAMNERVSRLASRFIREQKDEGLTGFAITPILNYESFPSALCLSMPGELEALVTFEMANQTSDPIGVQLTCQLQQFSLRAAEPVTVAPYESQTKEMQVTLISREAASLIKPDNTQVEVSYTISAPAAPGTLITKTFRARILPKDYFVFARRHKGKQNIVSTAWLIAAWVDREDKSVIELRAEAARLNNWSMPGYQTPDSPAAHQVLRSQVKALYDALYARKLTYGNRVLPQYQDTNNFGQTVRLPGKTIGDAQMNCLDGAVLFASLLASCDLDPGILFIPEHAMVGWKQSHSPGADWEFLEITDVTASDFDAALKNGRELFAKYETSVVDVGSLEPLEMKDVEKAAVRVDIRRVWAAGVTPIPA